MSRTAIAAGAIKLTTDYAEMVGGLRSAEREAAAGGKRIGDALGKQLQAGFNPQAIVSRLAGQIGGRFKTAVTATLKAGQVGNAVVAALVGADVLGRVTAGASRLASAVGRGVASGVESAGRAWGRFRRPSPAAPGYAQAVPPSPTFARRTPAINPQLALGPSSRSLALPTRSLAVVGRQSFGGAAEALPGVAAGAGRLAGVAGAATVAFAALAVTVGAAAAAVAGLAATVPRLKELAEVARTARVLGIDPQIYGGIAAAAKQNGVDGKALLEGLVDMSGRAAEALQGGQFAEAFQKLKLDPKQFKTLNIDQQFYRLADALGTVPDAGERARLALKFFGEDVGKQLLPLVAQGGAGVRRAVEEARAAGLVLDRDQQGRVDAAAKSVAGAEATLEGGWNKLTAAVAPLTGLLADGITALRPVIDWMTRALTPVATFAAGVGRAIGQAVASIGRWVGASLGGADAWPRIETVVTVALRSITVNAGLMADAVRAGIGAAAVAAGGLVRVLALSLRPVGALAAAAKQLPAHLRPAFVDGLADGVLAAEAAVKGAGESAERWGKQQIGAFGQYAAQAGAWFDKLMVKKQAVETIKPKVQVPPPEALWKGNAALAVNTQAAVSAEVRATMGALGDKQLIESRRANAIAAQNGTTLKDIAAKLPTFGVL